MGIKGGIAVMLQKQNAIKEDVRVIVETVRPLTDAQQTLVHKKLKSLLAPKTVACFFKLNPDLLSGIR